MSRTPKAELNELAQSKNTPLEFNTELLDPNRPNDGFISVVHWNNEETAKGYGRSKKDAEHDAARQALESLSGADLPVLEDGEEDLPLERWEIYPDLLCVKTPWHCIRICCLIWGTNQKNLKVKALCESAPRASRGRVGSCHHVE
jgi:hypothetical protein